MPPRAPRPPPQPAHLHVEAADERPPSLLRRRPPNAPAILGGCLTLVLVPSCAGVGGALLALFAAAHMARPDAAQASVAEVRPQIDFIPARLVKLGLPLDPRALPNRLRRARSTAPEQLARTPHRRHRRVHRPDAGPTPSDAVADLMARIGTSADRQAALARAAEQEGDPDGVPEGTATRDEGDLYRTRLYAFFRSGLTRPEELTDEELSGLRATVTVSAGMDGRIQSYRLRSSGNEVFDRKVRQRMDQAVGSYLPAPPDEVRDQYFGRSFSIGVVPPR